MSKKRWLKVTAIVCAAVILIAGIGVASLYTYSMEQNKTITVTEYTVSHEDIPAAFEGKRIVQLTDLHNKDFGDRLTELVKAQSPDVIVITGDWISRTDTDISAAKRQAAALIGIAPIYYVTGNHEAWSPLCAELLIYLHHIGVTVLENRAVEWEEDGQCVQLIGMYDPEFSAHLWRDFAPHVIEEMYSILLFHRPEYFKDAAGYGADLILAGHTHGGQIRLPLIGSLYAPDQGWFPTYDVGRYEHEGTTMIVGQGLGEDTSVRILTPPEVVVVTLDSPFI